MDGVVQENSGEECDEADDDSCPGGCRSHCTCGATGACCKDTRMCADRQLEEECRNGKEVWFKGQTVEKIEWTSDTDAWGIELLGSVSLDRKLVHLAQRGDNVLAGKANLLS